MAKLTSPSGPAGTLSLQPAGTFTDRAALPAESAELDTTGPNPELLDCHRNNLQVLLRQVGVKDLFGPFARDWAFRLPSGWTGSGIPDMSTVPVGQRIREDSGYAPEWRSLADGDRSAGRLAGGPAQAPSITAMTGRGHEARDWTASCSCRSCLSSAAREAGPAWSACMTG